MQHHNRKLHEASASEILNKIGSTWAESLEEDAEILGGYEVDKDGNRIDDTPVHIVFKEGANNSSTQWNLNEDTDDSEYDSEYDFEDELYAVPESYRKKKEDSRLKECGGYSKLREEELDDFDLEDPEEDDEDIFNDDELVDIDDEASGKIGTLARGWVEEGCHGKNCGNKLKEAEEFDDFDTQVQCDELTCQGIDAVEDPLEYDWDWDDIEYSDEDVDEHQELVDASNENRNWDKEFEDEQAVDQSGLVAVSDDDWDGDWDSIENEDEDNLSI